MNIKTIFVALLFSISPLCGTAQNDIKVSEDISLKRLSDRTYMYTAIAEINGFGTVPCNGLVILDGAEALLVDTPMDDAQTETLVNWVSDSLHAEVTKFIPTHWHGDCIGGLGYLQSNGVESYANSMTIDITRDKGLPVPDHGFSDTLNLKLGDTDIEAYYPGGGHSYDNIVVWIPEDKILFGGCLVKDMTAKGLGNTADADMKDWPRTVDKVSEKYRGAVIIVPGHGPEGGTELLEHTLELLKR